MTISKKLRSLLTYYYTITNTGSHTMYTIRRVCQILPKCFNNGNLIDWRYVKAPVTPSVRPGYDLPATEKWANRRKNVRLVAEVVQLVAEVVGDRKGQISRNKVVVMFKTRSHRAYDRKMLE